MNDVLKLLRYNTGNDKKAFIEFKSKFDAVVFNSPIVAYQGGAVADIISVHMDKYIIDPQTHILQHDAKNFLSPKGGIKASVAKYLAELPQQIEDIITNQRRALTVEDVDSISNDLAEKVLDFQVGYVSKYLTTRDYSKYLEYVGANEYKPKFVIAPYFMLKDSYRGEKLISWQNLNGKMLKEFIAYNNTFEAEKRYPIAAQLVMDKSTLERLDLEKIKEIYNDDGYEFIFIWIDEFSSFVANERLRKAFKNLLDTLNAINKKPIMAYGGFDSILLCHSELNSRLYGVAQSVGYGESRPITPIGGGIPINKYYFYPLHERMSFRDAADILMKQKYFTVTYNSKSEAAKRYYDNICDCAQCKDSIGNNIDGFNKYNESKSFNWKNDIKRNRPTTEASAIAVRHFMFSKIKEWESIENNSWRDITNRLKNDALLYGNNALQNSITSWLAIYEE